MIEKKLTIINKLGLHARAAALLVKMAEGFDADISISANNKKADATSIMDVLMIAATQGTEVFIQIDAIDSDDEEFILEEITKLINAKFYEKE